MAGVRLNILRGISGKVALRHQYTLSWLGWREGRNSLAILGKTARDGLEMVSISQARGKYLDKDWVSMYISPVSTI